MQSQDIVNAVQAAVSEVFSTMLGIEVEVCPGHRDATGPRTAEGVMSFVGLSGNWVGSGLITCNSRFACRLCSSFLMTESACVDGDVLDAVGEIANMVIGSFKTTAEAAVGPLALSIPTTIYGKSFMSKSLGSNEWTILPFRNGDDIFEVWIWFKPACDPHAHRHDAIQLQAV
jgi:chemotaxis protein CheX